MGIRLGICEAAEVHQILGQTGEAGILFSSSTVPFHGLQWRRLGGLLPELHGHVVEGLHGIGGRKVGVYGGLVVLQGCMWWFKLRLRHGLQGCLKSEAVLVMARGRLLLRLPRPALILCGHDLSALVTGSLKL
jgi:hypothetical protein